MRLRFSFLIVALALSLTGCGGGAAAYLADPAMASSVRAGSTVEHILIATTRLKDPDPAIMFSGERDSVVSFVSIGVSIPPDHQTGVVERPNRGAHDPAKHFYAVDRQHLSGPEAFAADVRREISGKSNKDVLVFVHGYRNTFSDAVFRFAQIVHDTGFEGTAVLFSWASRGKTQDYLYDRDSATAARDALEETLRLLAKTNARRIDLMAHSMGNWVTLEALRQLRIGDNRDLAGKLGQVILASPDVSVDVFKAQMARYGKPDRPFIVMLSRDDRALQVSRLLAGNTDRLGGYGDDAELAELGVIVVDLTDAESADRTNHFKVAENPELVKLLGDGLRGADGDLRRARFGDHLVTLGGGVGTILDSTAKVLITAPVAVIEAAGVPTQRQRGSTTPPRLAR